MRKFFLDIGDKVLIISDPREIEIRMNQKIILLRI